MMICPHVEKAGIGIRAIYKPYQEPGLKEPKFRQGAGRVVLDA